MKEQWSMPPSPQATTLALDQLSNLLGLNNPVPSPLADPVGFLTHPLITPILLGAITLNPAALALAMGGLAGNLVLTHMFTMAVSCSSQHSLTISHRISALPRVRACWPPPRRQWSPTRGLMGIIEAS